MIDVIVLALCVFGFAWTGGRMGPASRLFLDLCCLPGHIATGRRRVVVVVVVWQVECLHDLCEKIINIILCKS